MRTPPTAHLFAALAVALLLVCGGCSDPAPVGAGQCPLGFTCTASGDVTADGVAVGVDGVSADAAATGDAVSDASAGQIDAGALDSGPNDLDSGAGPVDGGGTAIDAGGFEQPDVGDQDTFFSQPVGELYAHTKDALYFLDVPAAAFKKVADFSFDKNKGLVTDIALNKWGNLFAVTYGDLFQCNRENGKCVWLAKLPQEFNGLTFIPEGIIDPVQEALVGIAGQGTWYHIQFAGGKVTLKAIGDYGGAWLSSGDAFSVVGVGTYATLKKSNGGDNYLAEVDPKTGSIIKIIGKTGSAKGLFGLAWWAGVFYAVSNDGNIYVLDVKTGDAIKVQGVSVPKGVQWWGAGVSTRAGG